MGKINLILVGIMYSPLQRFPIKIIKGGMTLVHYHLKFTHGWDEAGMKLITYGERFATSTLGKEDLVNLPLKSCIPPRYWTISLDGGGGFFQPKVVWLSGFADSTEIGPICEALFSVAYIHPDWFPSNVVLFKTYTRQTVIRELLIRLWWWIGFHLM